MCARWKVVVQGLVLTFRCKRGCDGCTVEYSRWSRRRRSRIASLHFPQEKKRVAVLESEVKRSSASSSTAVVRANEKENVAGMGNNASRDAAREEALRVAQERWVIDNDVAAGTVMSWLSL